MGDEKASGNHAATLRRRIAALIKAQVGGNFALYGSPLSLIWDVQRAPELKGCIEDWHLTEFRWCNMGVRHPETGQGFGSTTKVLSSIQLWSGIGRPVKCSCLEGPGHVEHSLNFLMAWQRRRVEGWE